MSTVPNANDPYPVQIAEMRKDVSHIMNDVRNMMLKMEQLVSRREIDDIHVRRKEAHAELEARIAKIEETQSRAGWMIITTWAAMILGALGIKVYGGH